MIGCAVKLPWNGFLTIENASGMKTHVAKHLFNNDSSVTTAGDQNFGEAERFWNDWLSGKTPLEWFSTNQKRLWNENSCGKTSLQ